MYKINPSINHFRENNLKMIKTIEAICLTRSMIIKSEISKIFNRKNNLDKNKSIFFKETKSNPKHWNLQKRWKSL